MTFYIWKQTAQDILSGLMTFVTLQKLTKNFKTDSEDTYMPSSENYSE